MTISVTHAGGVNEKKNYTRHKIVIGFITLKARLYITTMATKNCMGNISYNIKYSIGIRLGRLGICIITAVIAFGIQIYFFPIYIIQCT